MVAKRPVRTYCPFCRAQIPWHQREAHREQHRKEFQAAYAEVGRRFGVNLSLGSDSNQSWDAIGFSLHTARFTPLQQTTNINSFVTSLIPAIEALLQLPHLRHAFLRVQPVLRVEFERRILEDDDEEEEGDDDDVEREEVPIGGNITSVTEHNVGEWLEGFLGRIWPKIEDAALRASGWRLRRVLSLTLMFVCCRNDSGGAHEVPVPPSLKSVRWSPTIKGVKDFCFLESVLVCLAHADGRLKKGASEFRSPGKILRILAPKYNLNADNLPFPFEFKYLPTFEKRNNLRICVYHHGDNHVKGVLYAGGNTDAQRTIHLLWVSHPTHPNLSGHFRPVLSLTAMTHSMNKDKHNIKHACDTCLQTFRTDRSYELHIAFCNNLKQKQMTVTPNPKTLSTHCFQEHKKTTQPLNVYYADFESIIDPVTKVHKPAMIGVKEQWHQHLSHLNESKVHIFTGETCTLEFLSYLEERARNNIEMMKATRKRIAMTPEDWDRFHLTFTCEFCKVPFDDEHPKCRDHDHVTGKYVHALCGKCNLKRKQVRMKSTIIFHNFKGYDSHHLMKYGMAHKVEAGWDISPIYQSGEKILGLNVKIPLPVLYGEEPAQEEEEEEEEGEEEEENRQYFEEEIEVEMKKKKKVPGYHFVFIDSLQFLPGSLAKLSEALEEKPAMTAMLRDVYHQNIEEGLRLAKGVFPYSYFDSLDRLEETELPPIEAFYDDLNEKACTPEKYALAVEAWEKAKCRKFEHFAKYYCAGDVCLLCDNFEHLRYNVREASGLEATHFFGAPGLSFAWFYKLTRVELPVIRCPDMYNMFEEGIRGGMTQVNIHYAERELAPPESSEDNNLITYYDVNNLYGGSMSEKMPCGTLQWVTPEACDSQLTHEFFLNRFDPEGDDGYLLEVDLTYPPDVQERSMDLPFAPEAKDVDPADFTPYMRRLWKRHHDTKPFPKHNKKLLLTHKDKKHYIVHSRALSYYLQQGLILTKVHRAIHFKQAAYIKPYVDYHTRQRSQATTTTRKNLHKYMVNSLFGKTMENVRNHSKHILTFKHSILCKHAGNPLTETITPLGHHAVIIKQHKSHVVLNKPIYIGQAILDTSKIHMYRLLDTLKHHPQIHALNLIGGDTDSFFCKIKTPCLEDELVASFDTIDTSNYPPTHPNYSKAKAAKLHHFKDETCGKPIQSFIALRPKMYSYQYVRGGGGSRAKGIKGYKKDACLTHKDYKKAFTDLAKVSIQQTLINSKTHQLKTHSQIKQALILWDDKRAWISENKSVPFGYHRLRELCDDGEPSTKRPRVDA